MDCAGGTVPVGSVEVTEEVVKQAVNSEVRGEASQAQLNLLNGDLRLWRDTLQDVISGINDQLSTRRDDEEWKRKALSSLRRFEARLRSVKRLISDDNPDNLNRMVRWAYEIMTGEDSTPDDISLWIADYEKHFEKD